MSRSRPRRVAIQGERGAFSELAARSLFGPRVEILPCPDFDALFRAAEKGRCRFALNERRRGWPDKRAAGGTTWSQ